MATQRIERRLAAILTADIAGCSRLMEAYEEDTLARLKAHRRELIDPKITEHRGRIVKTTGDALLIEFRSTIEAVSCALALQRGMVERNAGVPEGERITCRIGVNLGDIIVEDGDIHGDGVNIAARLEGISEPGGICISEDAFRHVRGKIDAEFIDIGEQSLKNIARPLRVYRVRPVGAIILFSGVEHRGYFPLVPLDTRAHTPARARRALRRACWPCGGRSSTPLRPRAVRGGPHNGLPPRQRPHPSDSRQRAPASSPARS